MPNASNDAYVVIARRYRPQGFDELIGQEHVASALKGAIAAGRVGHAYLFTGARGVGKTSAARILAKALNCVRGPTADPCNECEICVGVTAGDDVDVIEIDGASNRRLDEVREILQNVPYRANRARFKIYIIDEVHMLTKEAFNALLKTLEEPPDHIKFIFATTEPQKLPITILSRCQRFDFVGIHTLAIENRLTHIAEEEDVKLDSEAAAILARRAAGSMRDGQSLLEQLLAGCRDRITTETVEEFLGLTPAVRIGQIATALANKDANEALVGVDAAIAGGTDVGMVLEQLHGFFRDAMVVSVGGKENQFLFALPSQFEHVRDVAERLQTESLLAVLQILDNAMGRMNLSVDMRTLVEMAIVRIARLEDLDSISGLIAELRGAQALPGRTADGSKKNRINAPSQPRRVIATESASNTPSHPSGKRPLTESDDATGGERPNQPIDPPPSTAPASLAEELLAAEKSLQSSPAKTTGPHFQSRREIQREVSSRPFVQQAMDIFGADPNGIQYSIKKPTE